MSSLPETSESGATKKGSTTTTTTTLQVQDATPGAVNESWRLCMEHKWTDLQMRLGAVPSEARVVQLETKRSLLHEIVSTALAEKDAPFPTGRRNRQQQQQNQIEMSEKEGISQDNIIKSQDYFSGSADITVPSINDCPRSTTSSNLIVASPLFLRVVYFSCPQAMLLQESEKGYTPLHCAVTLAMSTANGESARRATRVMDTLLELCQGQCVGDSDQDWFEESKEEDLYDDDSSSSSSTNTDENDVNERAVFLLRDHLGDTPLHTACRHGCSKYILQILTEACPSALCQSNHDGVTPMRLLWNNLEDHIKISSSSGDGMPAELKADKNDDHEAALASASEEASDLSSKLSILEDILENKIKTYEDLTKFPDIKETWEKSIMLLHILRTWDYSSKDENDSAIDGLMDHDIFKNFLMRPESRDFSLPTTTTPAFRTGEAHEDKQADLIRKKRKHVAPVVEIKGVELDEKGMIPMPSYESGNSKDAKGGRLATSHGSMRSYTQWERDEMTNLFFERA